MPIRITSAGSSLSKRIVLITAVAVLTALIILAAWPVIKSYQHSRVEMLEAGQHERFALQQKFVEHELSEAVRDIKLLRTLELSKLFNRKLPRKELQTLHDILPKLLDSRQRYSELQLIHPDGQEALHLYIGTEVTALAPTEQYNNLSQADYFRKGIALPKDTLYVHFETPNNKPAGTKPANTSPTIRLLTPIIDNKKTVGVLVLRLRTDDLLSGLWEKLPLLPIGYGAITNANGDWVGYEGQLQFANAKAQNLKAAAPQLWQAIITTGAGQFDDGSNIYIFQRISITQVVDALANSNRPLFKDLSLRFDNKASEFIVYTGYAKRDLLSLSSFERSTDKTIFASIIALSLVIFYILLSYSRQAKRYYLDQEATRKEMTDLYDNAPCGYFSIGPDLTITKINNTLAQWLESSVDEIVGKVKISSLLSTSDPQQVKKIFPALRENGSVNNLHLHLRGNRGKRIAVLANGIAIRDKSGNMIEARCALYDYREIEAMQQRLQTLATTDALTGLYQRKVFEEMASKEFNRRTRTESPLAVLLIDIDDFKDVAYGQETGDRVLMHLAQLFFNAFRQGDVIAKYSMERFAVMLPNTDVEGAQVIANRVREIVQTQPVKLAAGESINISISIGLSLVNNNDRAFSSVISRAGTALKTAGQNTLKILLDDPDRSA